MKELLAGEGVVRVRSRPEEVAAAATALAGLVPSTTSRSPRRNPAG